MKKYILPAMFLLLAGPVVSQAQNQPRELSLQECIGFALDNNETVKKALLDEKAAEYQIKEIKGSGLPQVNLNAQVSMSPVIPTMILKQGDQAVPIQLGTKYNAQGGVELQQLLFSQSYFVGLKAARSTRELYSLRSQMSREEVVYNITSAYYQVLQVQEQFSVIDANFSRLEQLEKLLDLQRKNDLARKVDVNRITVAKTNLESQRQALSANNERALNALKFFMGMPMQEQIAVADDVPNNLDKVLPTNEAGNAILAQRLDYQLLNKQRDLNMLNVKNIRAGYYPTLAAFATYNEQAMRPDFTLFRSGPDYPWFGSSQVGVRLSIPIFDGFQRRNRIKQAEVELQKLDQDLRQLQQNTQMSLDNATRQMQTSQKAIQDQERNTQLAREVYNTTNDLYKEGLSPLTDLLEAETSLREAETNLNVEKLKYKIAQLDYLSARGELLSLTK